MCLPGLDVIFRLAAPAVDIFVEHARVADVKIGDDEACIGAFVSDLDTGDDLLDAAPTCSAKNSLKRRGLPSFGAASKRAFMLASKGPRRTISSTADGAIR